MLLEAGGLFAGYRDGDVLFGIDVAVDAGERVALVGPNGSGKTTLLRVLAGVLPPRAGKVRLDGRDLAGMSARARACRIAVVPQTFETPFAFTAREVVRLGRTPHAGLFGRGDARDAESVARALAETDAIALADRPFAELSGGERQRVILAMALAQDPVVLLLDEPTAHLDLAAQLGILDLIRDLAAERGVAVLAVLHDVALAASRFERLVVLDAGRVVSDGPSREVLTPALLQTTFGVSADVVWQRDSAAIVPEPRPVAARSSG